MDNSGPQPLSSIHPKSPLPPAVIEMCFYSQLNCPQAGQDRRLCRAWPTVPTSLPLFLPQSLPSCHEASPKAPKFQDLYTGYSPFSFNSPLDFRFNSPLDFRLNAPFPLHVFISSDFSLKAPSSFR